MGRTACKEPQCLCKGDLYLYLTEKPKPLYSKSNIKLYTGVCLYFMYVTCKMNG